MTDQRLQRLSNRRQPRAWRRQIHLPFDRMEINKGFSLVELMIVAGLTAVVLAGLGVLTLVSDVKVGRRSNSLQEAQEQWSKAVTFIQNEVADADSLVGSLPTGYVCDGVKNNKVLVLNPTNPASTIIYGVRESNKKDDEGLFRGPQLLIRCGPFPNVTSPQRQIVLLDRLPAGNPFEVTLLGVAANNHFYDAELKITIKTDADTTYASDQPFRVHVQRTPSP
jgi:prepilin-type N-terminal cleavage/methylation domain-containing protein